MHAFFPSLLKAGILDDIKREIQQKEAEVLQLEAEKKQYEGTITQKRTQQRTLQNTIAALNAEISRLQVQQKITVTQISSTELSIRALGTQINQAESAIAKNLYRIGAVLRTLHEQAETHRTLVSLMLANQPLSAFLGQLTYTQSLEEELFDQTQLLTKTKKDLEGEKTSLQTEQQRLEELHDRLVAENGAKNSQQKQKNQLLTSTRNEEKRYQQLLKDAEKQRLEILKDIKELEDKLRRTIDPESIPAFRPGVLEWPAKGIMSQAYGNTSDTGFINDAYEFHNGIDVANHTGTPIRSARDGVIKAIGNNSPYAYGRWIAVEHDNNLTTLYAHLSSYAAGMRVGTAVKTGQAIAYMGATGYATGPHLHFTVYASNTFLTQDRWFGLLPLGGTINPQKYLP
ncbi:MAG: peptidoglycan DD-metalloendopeptidase family protein [bacterium]|nr:peptidoglycan DD-metalloendopeptidase family protein [bacterium]